MSMRSNEPGWIRLFKYDNAKRRSLWIRMFDNKIEFCAGREGDDSYVSLNLKKVNTDKKMYELLDTIQTGQYSVDIDE